MKILKALYAKTPAADFGPLALKSIANRLIEDPRLSGFMLEWWPPIPARKESNEVSLEQFLKLEPQGKAGKPRAKSRKK